MKIVQYMLGFRFRDGGVVRALIDLCNALAARSHEVRVMTTDASDAPANWNGRDGRPSLTVLGFHRVGEGVLTRSAKQQAAQVLHGADVLHLHVPWDLICIQLGRMARRKGIPYVVTVHGMLDEWTMRGRPLKKRAYLSLFGRRFLERAALVQSAATIEAEQSQKWYPRGRSIVIPLLLDLREFAQLPGEGPAKEKFPQAFSQPHRILYLGRIHPIKRIELLIAATARLRAEALAFNLVIAGTGEKGYEQSLRDLVARDGLADRTQFLGFVSGECKLSLYQTSDVAVLPSAHESFGLALVEAMACGTPGIGTRGLNIWPELEATGGAIIAGDQPETLAREIALLLKVRALRDAIGQRARNGVYHWLDPQRVIIQYEDMYRQAVADR
jgi:glycosyltransferase involved in cell wall biosynthesis